MTPPPRQHSPTDRQIDPDYQHDQGILQTFAITLRGYADRAARMAVWLAVFAVGLFAILALWTVISTTIVFPATDASAQGAYFFWSMIGVLFVVVVWGKALRQHYRI